MADQIDDAHVDLDALVGALQVHRGSWVAAGLEVVIPTWRDRVAPWPQPIVTDRDSVAEPESFGITFRGPADREAEIVFWTGGWADVSGWIDGDLVTEVPFFSDVDACLKVVDSVFHRLLG